MYGLFLRLLKSIYEYISRLFLHGFFIVPKSILFDTILYNDCSVFGDAFGETRIFFLVRFHKHIKTLGNIRVLWTSAIKKMVSQPVSKLLSVADSECSTKNNDKQQKVPKIHIFIWK